MRIFQQTFKRTEELRMYPVTISILLLIGLTAFAYSMYKRIVILFVAQGKADHIKDFGARLKTVLIYAFGQKRLLFRDFKAGLMHGIIFWGLLVICFRLLTLFIMGFKADFALPGFEHGVFALIFNFTLNSFLVLIVLACLYFLYLRLIAKSERLNLNAEGIFVLCMLISFSLFDFLFEGAVFALNGSGEPGAFMGVLVGNMLTGLSPSTLGVLKGIGYLVHLTLVLAFINYLPYGKQFHEITFLPNVLLHNRKPKGELTKIDLTDESATTFGNSRIEQFSWKNYLDWYTCTECGRCSSQCPAHNSEKPLSPKNLTKDLKTYLFKKTDNLVAKYRGKYDGSIDDLGLIPDEKPLLADTISHDVLWSCTSCRACEEACPVFIDYVQEIVDMRRHLVLMEGQFPPELQTVFQNLERNSNPWGISFNDRANWAKDLNIPIMANNPEVEYLYFVGCAGSFDEKNKKVSRAVAKLLQKAGVTFGILGTEEKCNGDSARRLGNEYLAQSLMQENIATLEKYKVKKIITSCPHCYNTIKNEYPEFGGNYEVYTHAELLNQLVKEGKLTPQKEVQTTTTFHDSCYLGRYNDVYEASRELLNTIPGVKVVEMENTKDKGRCCGAGGGRMWLEENLGKRVNQMRLEDVKETEANSVSTACPFCKIMLSDAINETSTENMTSRDIAEVLLESEGE